MSDIPWHHNWFERTRFQRSVRPEISVCPCVTFLDKLHSDNLYLDFNGIIHNCTCYPGCYDILYLKLESQVHIRTMMTPIFDFRKNRFSRPFLRMWIILFGKIKPQKLFFMAVDGVASWEKMDQNKPDGFELPRRRGRLDTRRWPRARRERIFYHPRFAVLDMKWTILLNLSPYDAPIRTATAGSSWLST